MRRTIIQRLAVVSLFAAGSMLMSVGSALALPVFGDPSFEAVVAGPITNSFGDATYAMDPAYHEDAGNGGGWLNAFSPGKWLRGATNNTSNGVLRWFTCESTSDYKGYTSAPAGVTGSYFFTGSRDEAQTRGFMQYVLDNKATKGSLTVTIDLWSRELNAADSPSGGGDVWFCLIAFDDPSTIRFDPADNATAYFDVLTNSTAYISSTNVYTYHAAVSAGTGFTTLSATLDLGSGYNYIGAVISNYGFDDPRNTGASGETSSFDNLQVLPQSSVGTLFVFE